MKILLTCIEEPSHLRTMVPLAWALIAAGHEVRVAGGPGLMPTIVGAGLPAVRVGEAAGADELLALAAQQGGDLENVLTDWTRPQDPDEDWDTRLLRYQVAVPMAFGLYNDPLLEDLVDFARYWRPDLVLWESLTYAGPIAAVASGAQHARINWMHDIYGAMRETFVAQLAQQREHQREDPLREWFEGHLQKYHVPFAEHLVAGGWTFDLIPPEQQFRTGHTRVPVCPLPYTSDATFPRDVPQPGGRPRVCVTAGVSFGDTFGVDFLNLDATLAALGEMDVEVVAAVRPEQISAPLPSNVVHAGYVPLSFLLPSCAAVLHHGGFGTWAHALLRGIPQHITSIRHGDITIKGQYLAEAGAGMLRHPRELTPETLRQDVSALVFDPSARLQAQALAHEVHSLPTPADAVTSLDELLEQHA